MKDMKELKELKEKLHVLHELHGDLSLFVVPARAWMLLEANPYVKQSLMR